LELKAMLFDVDGTLADTERDGHRVAFNAAFREAGLDWNWSVPVYGELLAVTGGKERIRHYMERFDVEPPLTGDISEFIADLHRCKTRIYTELLAEGGIPLRSGVRRLLMEARACGIRLGVATTTTPENVTALIENTLGGAPEAWFDVVAAGDVVPAKKPAPDIYQYALERLGVGPESCVAFEDSENGLRSAIDSGIETTIITLNDYTRDHDFRGASLVLDHLGEPDAPCVVVGGLLRDVPYVDVDVVVRLLQANRYRSVDSD